MKETKINEDLQAPGYVAPTEDKKGKQQNNEVEHDTEGGGVFDTEGKGPVLQTKELPDAEQKFNLNRASIQTPKVSPTVQAEDLENYFGNLFAGEEISEEFQNKVSVIFETAVSAKVANIQEVMDEQYQEAFNEQVDALSTDLSNKLDEYLEYVVDTWLQENKLTVEQGIRTEIAENFIEGLKGLFETNNIDIPESKIDVSEQVIYDYNQLAEYTNQLMENNMQLYSQLNEVNAGLIFNHACHGLTDIEVEKFVSLAEGIEFVDAESYTNKLNVIKNNYFLENPIITEEEPETSINEMVDLDGSPMMNAYMNTLSRISKK